MSVRTDNYGSLRTVVDFNEPLLKNKLGLRIVNLRDRQKDWREPAYSNQDRFFASVVATPFKKVSVRGYFERSFTRQQAALDSLVQDHVTPWIALGRPTFNNSGTTFTAPPTIVPVDPTNPPTNPNTVFSREIANPRPYVTVDASGAISSVGSLTNTVFINGYDGLTRAPNNFERSLLDESLYPFDVSPSGNGNGNKTQSWIRGAILEVNPVKDLYLEAAVNQENLRQRGVMLFRGTDVDLRVDANQFVDAGLADINGTTDPLPNSPRTTPNPRLGQYYLQGNNDATANGRKNYFTRDQRRLSAAYDLNFTGRKGWSRWLGRHRLAGMYEELTTTRLAQNQDFRIVSNNSFIPARAGTALDNLSGSTPATPGAPSPDHRQSLVNLRQPIFRYYIDADHPWAQVPFDIMASGVQTLPVTDSAGQAVQIAGFDSPFGATAATTGQKNRQASTTFAMQNVFLSGRLVLTYGRRKDDVKIYQPTGAIVNQHVVPGNANSGFVRLDDLLAGDGVGWLKVTRKTPVTSTKGAVAHVFPWLSLSYSEASSQLVNTAALANNLDGSPAVNGAGSGKDYGVTIRLSDRVSIRLLKYETNSIGAASAFRLNNPVGTISSSGTTFGNNMRNDIIAVERSIKVATDAAGAAFPYSDKYRYFQERINDLAAGTFIDPNIWAFQSDRTAKGYELTITGNPTKRWRLAVSAAKSHSAETNVGPQWFDFVQERKDIWSQYLSQPIHNAQALTVGQVLGAAVNNFNYIQRAQGKPNFRERQYRLTATTRYSFDRGWLKGTDVGGTYTWRSPSVVGWPQITITDNPFIIPGVTPAGGTLTVDDQEHPIKGGSITTCDVFAGYGRKLSGGKVSWRVQLNIRNALGREDPLLQRALTTGEGAIYTVPEPRSFILTNTFSF